MSLKTRQRTVLRTSKRTRREKGLIWLTPSKFSNTYALALPKNVADQYPQINTISELNRVLRKEAKTNNLVALDTEFANRSDGLDGMVKLYDMNLTRKNIRQMDAGLVYTALRNGQVFAGLVYTTDGRLNAFKLKLLEDDKHYFPGLHRSARGASGLPRCASATGRTAQAAG